MKKNSVAIKVISSILLISFLWFDISYAAGDPARTTVSTPTGLGDIRIENGPDGKPAVTITGHDLNPVLGAPILFRIIAESLAEDLSLNTSDVMELIDGSMGYFISVGAIDKYDWQGIHEEGGSLLLPLSGSGFELKFARLPGTFHPAAGGSAREDIIRIKDGWVQVTKVERSVGSKDPATRKLNIPVTMSAARKKGQETGLPKIRREKEQVIYVNRLELGRSFKDTKTQDIDRGAAQGEAIINAEAVYLHAIHNILGELQAANKGKNIVNEVFSRLAGMGRTEIQLIYLKDNDTLCDFRPLSEDGEDRGTGIGIDLDIINLANELGVEINDGSIKDRKSNLRALALLTALSVLHELDHASGKTDEKEVMRRSLEFFELLGEKDRALIINLLRTSKTIDVGNSFAFFLEMATNRELPFRFLNMPQKVSSDAERARRIYDWQELWISWAIFRAGIDEPFNGELIRKAMLESKTPGELRQRLFEVMKGSYDRKTDQANIRMMYEDALEKGQKLFYVLFGRAFWMPATLIADSTTVDTEVLRPYASELRNVRDSRDAIDSALEAMRSAGVTSKKDMDKETAKLFALIGSPIDRLIQLVTRPAVRSVPVTRAELNGAIRIARDQLEEYLIKGSRAFILSLLKDNESAIAAEKKEELLLAVFKKHSSELEPKARKLWDNLKRSDPNVTLRSAMIEVVKASPYNNEYMTADLSAVRSRTEESIMGLSRALQAKADAFDRAYTTFSQGVAIAPQTEAAKIILGRRIDKDIGTYDTALVMHMVDPFTRDWTGGENPLLAKSLRDGANNMYISQDMSALEYASDMLIPLPLFIWQNQIDYKTLERTLRSWFGAIYKNIKRARDSEFIALAREIVANRVPAIKDALAADMPDEEREEFIRQEVRKSEVLQRQVAFLASLIKKSVTGSIEVSTAIAEYTGKKQSEGEDVDSYAVLKAVLMTNGSNDNLLRRALEDKGKFDAVLEGMVKENALVDSANSLQPSASARRESPRNIMIGTTQSLGMTEYLLGYWMLEELFINSVKDGFHLGAEMDAKNKEYSKLLSLAAGRLVVENPVLETELGGAAFAGDSPKRDEALARLVDKFEDVSRSSATLLRLAELAMREGDLVERYVGKHNGALRRSAEVVIAERHKKEIEVSGLQAAEFISRNEHVRIELENEMLSQAKIVVVGGLLSGDEAACGVDNFDFQRTIRDGSGRVWSVSGYISENAQALKDAAIAELLEAYKDQIDDELMHKKTTRISILTDIVGGGAELDHAVDKIIKRIARREVLKRLLVRYKSIDDNNKAMDAYLDRYVYDRRDVGATTAAKEVIGRHNLSSLSIDPRYCLNYKGMFKAFNYAYTPSRVDFSREETEFASTGIWAQWVGATDIRSAHDISRTLALFNENPASFLSPYPAEGAKPAENTGLLASAVKGTIDGLSFNASGWGDAETMMDYTNGRTKPSPRVEAKPAQEGAGGFCLPKDWEFVRFCLSLTNEKKLVYYGISDKTDQEEMLKFAREMYRKYLSGKKDVREFLDSLYVLQQELSNNELINKYFTLMEGYVYLPNFVVFSEALEKFGIPTTEGPSQERNRMARFNHDLVTQQIEKANRAHGFVKAWEIRNAARKAQGRNKTAKEFHQMTVVRGSEYKADRTGPAVRDPRNAISMYIAEIFARTAGYRLDMSTKEEHGEVESWLWGHRINDIDMLIDLIGESKYVPVIKNISEKKGAQTVDELFDIINNIADGARDEAITGQEASLMAYTLKNFLLEKLLDSMPMELAFKVNEMIDAGVMDKLNDADELISALWKIDGRVALSVEEFWYGTRPPQEIIYVTTTGQTEKDLIGYHVDAEIQKHIDYVKTMLIAKGMDEGQIRANAIAYGGDLRKWTVLKDLPEAEFDILERRIRGKLLLALMYYMGIVGGDQAYATAARGADIIDTGICPIELMELLRDPHYLRDLMVYQNPNSALAIVDGSSQARVRAMTRRMVKMWFSADNRAVYSALGVGDEEIEQWRFDMERERREARLIFEYLRAGEFAKAQELYYKMQKSLFTEMRLKALIDDEDKAKRIGTFDEVNRIETEGLTRFREGLRLQELDFGTWLVLGGAYILDGQTRTNIDDAKRQFAAALTEYRRWLAKQGRQEARKAADLKPYSREDQDRMERALVHEKRHLEVSETSENSKTGSLKTAEGLRKETSVAQRLKEARLKEEKNKAISARKEGYKKALQSPEVERPGRRFADIYDDAMACIGDGSTGIKDADFGAFLGFTREYIRKLILSVLPEGDPDRVVMLQDVENLFSGCEIKVKQWQRIIGSYEYPGALGILAEKISGTTEEKRLKLRRDVAPACELAYIAYALEETIAFSQRSRADLNEGDVWNGIAQVMSEIFYDHVSDYPPPFGQTLRGTGFTDYDYLKGPYRDQSGELKVGKPFTRDEILDIGVERYGWIYRYMRGLIVTRTSFADMDEMDLGFYVGDIEKETYPAGSTSTTLRESQWFGITHLREVAFYRREGMPIPQRLFIEAATIKADERVNEVYISGLYRQHMITGVEEGPTLQRIAPVNVMITRNLRRIENYKNSGRDALVVDDAYIFLSREDFIRAYMETNLRSDRAEVERIADAELKKNPKGIFCAVRFMTPVTADVMIPLHGHPLYVSGELERLGYPVTVNGSRETEDVAYDKSVYPMIYDEEIGSWVQMPGEMDFRREMALDATGNRISDAELIRLLRKGNKDFLGFEKFIAKYGEIIIKAGSQSGGRMSTVCSSVDKAVEFLKLNVMNDNFAIQFYIRVSPGMILTPEAILTARERLAKKGLAVDMQRTKTYWGIFARSIAISDNPETPHKIFHHLFGISVDKIGNVGRGGIIEEMLVRYFDERLQGVVYRRIAEHARQSMQDFGNFLAGPYLETYRRERGEDPGATLTGIPYTWVPYMMHDFLIVPIFRRVGGGVLDLADAKLVDTEIIYDKDSGKPTGMKFIMEPRAGGDRFEAEPFDVEIIKIEDNTGTGLKHPFKWGGEFQRRKREIAEEKGVSPDEVTRDMVDPDDYGRQLRIMLYYFAKTGAADRKARLSEEIAWPQDESAAEALEQKLPEESAWDRAKANKLWTVAAQRSARMLKASGGRISKDGLSVVLKEFAKSWVVSEFGGIENIRSNMTSDESLIPAMRRMAFQLLYNHKEIFDMLATGKDIKLAQGVLDKMRDILRSRSYIDRISELAVSDIVVDPVHPELEVVIDNVGSKGVDAIFGKKTMHTIIFEEPLTSMNDMFVLLKSAESFNARQASPGLMVRPVCVKKEWLDLKTGTMRKAIYFDAENDILKEVTFSKPVPLAGTVDIRHLDTATEQNTHYALSEAIDALDRGIIQVNPSGTSRRADSKKWTHDIWESEDVSTPGSLFLSQETTRSDIEARLQEFFAQVNNGEESIHIVVQPNFGTEGEDVRDFHAKVTDMQEGSALFDYVYSLSRRSSMVITAAVGNVFYSPSQKPDDPDVRRFVLRTNVVYDGKGRGYSVDSYGAFVSGSADQFIVSRRTGGEHIAVNGRDGLFDNLWVKTADGYRKVEMTPRNIAKLEAEICDAVKAQNSDVSRRNKRLLFGLDVILEARASADGSVEVVPYLKEDNARPVGLIYCEPVGRSRGALEGYWDALFAARAGDADTAASMMRQGVSPSDIIMKLIIEDIDVSHKIILHKVPARTNKAMMKVLEDLSAFLKLDHHDSPYPNIYLLQERAILVLGDCLWKMKQKGILPSDGMIDNILRHVSDKTVTLNRIKAALMAAEDPGDPEGNYIVFINQFLAAVNERELKDFQRSKEELLSSVPTRPSSSLRIKDPSLLYRVDAPMRVGISSANASDNWTFSKLKSGMVINFAVDLALDVDLARPDETGGEPKPPVRVELDTIDEPQIILETYSKMDVDGRSARVVLDRANAIRFLSPSGKHNSAIDGIRKQRSPERIIEILVRLLGAEDTFVLGVVELLGREGIEAVTDDRLEEWRWVLASKMGFSAQDCFKDIKDPLLILKYSLAFSNIVGFKESPGEYINDPGKIIDDILRFTGGRGIRLVVHSETAPSRSGFASSSTVAAALLKVLYESSAQTELAGRDILSNMTLLLENEVGLKSGKQDTDGPIFPGIKSLLYLATEKFLDGDVETLEMNEKELQENLVLVNSGIQRPPAEGRGRGLNRRHESYVSRDPQRFGAVKRSLTIHRRIVRAVKAGDWEKLGRLFNEYMDLREKIDPGATQSIFDAEAGIPVLRHPFERLMKEGLIYGGMFSGAMGGGCMMLVPTPKGKELIDGKRTRLDAALENIREFTVGESTKPFAGMSKYLYGVNTEGIKYDEIRASGGSTVTRTAPSKFTPGRDGGAVDFAKAYEEDAAEFQSHMTSLRSRLPSAPHQSPNGLVMYADAILEKGAIFDIEATLTDQAVRSKKVLSGGVIFLYTKGDKNNDEVAKLAGLIKRSDSSIDVVVVDLNDLGISVPAQDSEFMEMDMLKRRMVQALKQRAGASAAAVDGNNILGIMRGPTSRMHRLAEDARRLETPVVVYTEAGFNSFALGLSEAMRIRKDADPRKAWFAYLGPIRRLTEGMAEQFQVYVAEVLTRA